MDTGSDTSVHIYFGNANGTFGSGITLSGITGIYSQWSAAVDLNADGNTDLLLLQPQNIPSNVAAPMVNVFYGLGNKMFTAAKSDMLLGQNLQMLHLADFNGDGLADVLAITGVGLSPQPYPFQIGLATADGNRPFALSTYGENTAAEYGGLQLAVATYDVNRDNLPDLLWMSWYSSGLSVGLNIGNGFFALGAVYFDLCRARQRARCASTSCVIPYGPKSAQPCRRRPQR